VKAPALADYAPAAGPEVIDALLRLARPLRGRRVVHVNSTRVGGGVAEILSRLVPLMTELGLDARWEVIEGPSEFYTLTKMMHNALQGVPVTPSQHLMDLYDEVNRETAKALAPVLLDADFVFIHDPQPAPLLKHLAARRGRWVWRCHIDVSRPHRPVWKALRPIVMPYDAIVYSLPAFAQALPHPQYVIAPSIDPLSEKNVPLEPREIDAVATRFGLDPARPVVLQVSRFDRFKDPVGVIQAYRIARRRVPIQLVLAGGGATDDPEGEAVLAEVREAAGNDPDLHILLLPNDAHRDINALQRRADLVLQKSLKEGFGLTVTEALWKGKPVIGGQAGGIVLQVVNYHTGFLVNTPEGAAFRIRYLLNRPHAMATMGEKARRFVRENFLLTRQLREYLTLMHALQAGGADRVMIA
jgi:trehalose synthase